MSRPIQADAAGIGAQHARHQVERRSLARAVGPEQTHDLTMSDFKAEIVDSDQPAEGAPQAGIVGEAGGDPFDGAAQVIGQPARPPAGAEVVEGGQGAGPEAETTSTGTARPPTRRPGGPPPGRRSPGSRSGARQRHQGRLTPRKRMPGYESSAGPYTPCTVWFLLPKTVRAWALRFGSPWPSPPP